MQPPEPEVFVAHDPAFAAIVAAARLVKVIDTDAHEGPVYVRDEDALYFTTLPGLTDVPMPGSHGVAIRRVALDGDCFPVGVEQVSTVRQTANMANGMALDGAGRLLVCEQGTRFEHGRISRLDARGGGIETVVDN